MRFRHAAGEQRSDVTRTAESALAETSSRGIFADAEPRGAPELASRAARRSVARRAILIWSCVPRSMKCA